MPIDLNKGPGLSGASDPWRDDLYAPPEDDQIIRNEGFEGFDAPRGKRFGGAFLDGIFGLVAGLVGLFIFGGVLGFDSEENLAFGFYILLLPFSILQMFLIATRGQSLGKMVVGTRIVMVDGRDVGFLHGVVLRSWIVGALGFIPILGPIISFIDPLFIFGEDHRCMHDHIAGTRVVEAA
ncbi:RDD family protein [Myxococcota bacterium]|nr:RDD family protein [Myxococcota bacterium]MBU1431992.1 RDD family protein [Myxococcota bacterium]MBU1897030.1 RDD family protein [Myxococcota bacterium]